MAATIKPGQTTWSCSWDEDGFREYKIKFRLKTDLSLEGPATVLACPDLPQPGQIWEFDNDFDDAAYCLYARTATPQLGEDDGKNFHWVVECTFSTNPKKFDRCTTVPLDDPLQEPAKISGSGAKYTEEATHDRFGLRLVSSSHEQLRGAQVEFDVNRSSIRIEQNVAELDDYFVNTLKDHVNDAELWGYPPRCVKLSNFTWERKFYGECYCYYTRVFEFEVNVNTFDRLVPDRGHLVLAGDWRKLTDGSFVYKIKDGTDPGNPSDFTAYRDYNGNLVEVFLDGHGLPAGAIVWGDDPESTTGTGTTSEATGPADILVEKYDEGNFLLLGIPAVLGCNP